jgi:hypothetical protein
MKSEDIDINLKMIYNNLKILTQYRLEIERSRTADWKK